MSVTANQYRSHPDFSGTTSTGSLLSADFGFDASYIRVSNNGTVPLRVTLTSSVATTADAELPPGEILVMDRVPTHVLGLMTTSTATGLADFRRARVLALGG
ncbi:MAG TPA: hypothetical protein DCP69_11270 [Candidatus Omnitrophica bacterium]|nr:hypothetical protein [Candidatus Omnitrophota bacterium]